MRTNKDLEKNSRDVTAIGKVCLFFSGVAPLAELTYPPLFDIDSKWVMSALAISGLFYIAGALWALAADARG